MQHLSPLSPPPLAAFTGGMAPLQHLGVIRVTGDDAAKFLHNQLSQDFVLQKPHEARLAAFCSPKGRMLASFYGIKRADGEIWLMCHRDILAPTLKRLSMFVLRAKVRLSDASDELAIHGLMGDAVTQALATLALGGQPNIPETIADSPYPQRASAQNGSENWVFLEPVQGQARALWIAPPDVAQPVSLPSVRDEVNASDKARASAATDTARAHWHWLEVMSGVALVNAATAEAFVPQMLNYESVGGVNFKKGCYPGQEVVARSQFRGTLKRRAYLVHSDAELCAGDALYLHVSEAELGQAQPEQDLPEPCGLVAQAAANPNGGYDAIVSAQIAALQPLLDGGNPAPSAGITLHARAPDGPLLALSAVPYPLLADI